MKKKIISLILVISILLSVFPVSVLTTAAEDSAIPATRDEVTKLQSDDDLEINSSAVAAKDTELAETKGAITISLHVWVSDSAFGSVPEKFVARDRVYLCYELIDKNTGQKINSLVNKSYSAVLTLYKPDGSVLYSSQVDDDDNYWISSVPYEAGVYKGIVSVSGDVNVTCDVSFTLVYDATLTSSFSSISLNMNGTNSKTSIITVSGGYPGKYSIQYKIGNTSIVSASWGEWDNATIPITITGKRPGTTEVTINLLERYTGNDNIVKSITIPVTVTAGTLSVNTSNTATVSTGGDIKYFTYTPSTSGTYVIYSTGSVDTKVYLYNSSGTELDNDDDSGDGNNFRLEYNLTAGTKYTFGVKYYDSTIIGTISFKFGNVYTITYNANGGTGVPSSQKKDYGTNIALSDTIPSRSGYTFLGWSTSSTATSATYQPGSTFSSNANTTLYAVWDESTYTVSYNSNGGSGAPASQTKTHGVDLVLSSTIPTRLGYTFLGWSTSNTASTATYLPEATFTSNADTTLYAVWKQTTLNSGSSNTAQIAFGGQMYYYKFTPSKSGDYVMYSTGADDTRVYLYDSSGTQLSSDDDGGDGTNFRLEYDFSGGTTYFFGVRYYSPSETGTISFKFGNVYTITYNANGGTGAPSSQEKDYGTATTLSTTVPSRSGYTFLGWSTSSTSSTATYQPGNSFASNVDTTLYAVWDEITYTVSYNSNGGSGAPASQTKTHGVDLELSSEIPYRMGYTFLGWSTSNTASTATYLPGANFTSNSDTTLYAVWKQPTLNSGSSNTAQINFEDQMYYYKFTPSKSGDYVIYSTGSVDTIVCLFDENGTQLSSDDDGGDGTNFRLEYELTAGTTYLFGVRYCSVIETGSISFKFGEVYTIDYIADDADIVPVGHYKDYGTGVTLNTLVPSRDGYTFLGWSTSRTSSTAEYQPGDTFTANEDTVLYAVWKLNRELIDMNIVLCTVDTCYVGDSLNVTALQLNLTYSDGTNEFVRSGYTISGFDSSTSGAKTVTVSYQGFTDTFTVTVNIPSVALSSTNELLYVEETAALTATTTPSGKSVTWTSSDTSVATVSNGVITAKSKGTASITAEFTYNGIKYSKVCSVTVLEEVVTYMYVYQEPTKIQYYIGDSLNTSGLKLRLNYSDGTVETVTSGFTTSGFSSTSAGTKTVTVIYKGEMTSFTVIVNTPSVALSSYSNTLKKGHATTITATTTPSGQSVTWTSSDTSVATVSNGLITAKAKGTTDITAEFTYNGITYRNTCVVNCIEPVGVEIDTLPNKTVFYIGDYFERVGLRLKMLYSDGSYEHGLGVTSTSLDEVAVFLSEGTREVLVYYGEYSTSYQITVNPFYAKLLTTQANLNIGEVSQIAYETSPGDMSQLVSATWSSSNTNVARVDQYGLVAAVGVGTAEITLSIVNGGCGTTSNICTVTVSKKIDDVSIRKSPAKASYYIGDALDTSGLELLATYDDGSTEIITSGFTTSGFNSATAGTKTVTVSYQGFTDIFSVTVNTPSVALSTNSEVLEEGDTATLTATTTPSGQSITWISSDTSVATVSNGVITAKSKGTANITAEFTYNGVKYSQVCSVTVIEEVIELTSIAVSQEPTITQYYVGDSLDTSGLKLKLTYSDGSRATVTRDFTTSGFDSSTSGTKTVTVSYQGFTDTFTVTVNTPSVVLSTDSETLEERDTATLTATTTPSGQSVTWTSSDTSVATVSNGVITAKSKGTANITAEFTYNGVKYSEVCSVTVIEEAIEITSISVYQEPTKTIYYLGDTFDRRGLMVQVHYSNGDVSLLSGGFVTSGFNSTTAGTKTIKVSYQGYTDKFTVTVNIPSIAVSPIRKALNAGDTAILTATTAPGEQSVTWTSSDPNVATVSDGKVKAVCEGTAVIRAEFTYSGVVYSQECVVTVLESILGDVDGDGKITIVDATLVQRSVAKLETLTEDQILRADTDKDGKISVMDATIIQRFVAKLIEKF